MRRPYASLFSSYQLNALSQLCDYKSSMLVRQPLTESSALSDIGIFNDNDDNDDDDIKEAGEKARGKSHRMVEGATAGIDGPRNFLANPNAQLTESSSGTFTNSPKAVDEDDIDEWSD
tara:strand:- start:3 stop:356 length:354 start_codon:yes stop_codon:yes gene_type:complete